MTILRGFPTSLLILGLLASVSSLTEPAAQSQPSSLEVVQEVKVTLLSTNLADVPGVGEWGLSALVEVDGRCILFDAGRYPEKPCFATPKNRMSISPVSRTWFSATITETTMVV